MIFLKKKKACYSFYHYLNQISTIVSIQFCEKHMAMIEVGTLSWWPKGSLNISKGSGSKNQETLRTIHELHMKHVATGESFLL